MSLSGTERFKICPRLQKKCAFFLCSGHAVSEQGEAVWRSASDVRWIKGNSDLRKGLRGDCEADTPKRKNFLKRLILVMVSMHVFLVSRMAYVLLKFPIWGFGFHWKFTGYQEYWILHYQLWAPDSSLKILMSSFRMLNWLHMSASCVLLSKFSACLNLLLLKHFRWCSEWKKFTSMLSLWIYVTLSEGIDSFLYRRHLFSELFWSKNII